MPGSGVSADTRRHALEQVQQLARQGLDAVAFLTAAGRVLQRAVPFDPDVLPNPCWATLDPTSLLATSLIEGSPRDRRCEMPPEEWAQFEYASETFGNRISDVIRHPQGLQTTSELYAADPGRADEYRAVLAAINVEHEVLVALQAGDGSHWGAFFLTRQPGWPDFSAAELQFLRAVAPELAEGVRRGLLLGEASEPEGPDAPAIVVLGPNLDPESLTPGAEQWLADLPKADMRSLPPAVLAVAQTVLHPRGGQERTVGARVRSETRGWVMLHGQALAGHGARRVAVTMQQAGPDRITPLLMAAYGLTEREEEVTRHVLQGSSTTRIAEALSISPYTVQDHLKSIFDKTSVSSRRELAGRVFTRHYEPRVEDNIERVEAGRPVRGGPAAVISYGAERGRPRPR